MSKQLYFNLISSELWIAACELIAWQLNTYCIVGGIKISKFHLPVSKTREIGQIAYAQAEFSLPASSLVMKGAAVCLWWILSHSTSFHHLWRPHYDVYSPWTAYLQTQTTRPPIYGSFNDPTYSREIRNIRIITVQEFHKCFEFPKIESSCSDVI